MVGWTARNTKANLAPHDAKWPRCESQSCSSLLLLFRLSFCDRPRSVRETERKIERKNERKRERESGERERERKKERKKESKEARKQSKEARKEGGRKKGKLSYFPLPLPRHSNPPAMAASSMATSSFPLSCGIRPWKYLLTSMLRTSRPSIGAAHEPDHPSSPPVHAILLPFHVALPPVEGIT